MGAKKAVESRVVIAASIALVCVCACGARSDLETMGKAPATTTSSCHDDGGAGGGLEAPGCVLHAYDVNGADLGPTTLTIPELPQGSPIEGYWLVGFNIAILGDAGGGHWFQIWGDDVDTLACGTSLSLNEPGPNSAVLRWWGTSTDFWASTSGTIDVVFYEPGESLERRPIHLEIHGASMAPGGTPLGSAPNHATGTFTADLSCRLEKFWHIPPH